MRRRAALRSLLGLAVAALPWRTAAGRAGSDDDPVRLVDGWLLRQSDLDALGRRGALAAPARRRVP
jgi:hypothetical protein